jgi:hypothetical protein
VPGDFHTFQFGAAQFVFDPTGRDGTHIKFRLPSLQLMLANRGQLPVGAEWKSAGIYFLFGAGDQGGTYRIYVGMAPAGVAKRAAEQEKLKDWWDRALLVVADRSGGFSTSEVAWLEARFIAKLRNELGQSVANKVQPTGDQLEPWIEKELEAHVAPIEAVLRLLGMLSVSAEPQIVNDEEPEEADETSLEPATTVRPRQELTWVEAALQVLPGDGSSLHVRDIVRLVREEGLRDLSNARTPEATLRRELRQESQREKPKVTQTAPSTFTKAS